MAHTEEYQEREYRTAPATHGEVTEKPKTTAKIMTGVSTTEALAGAGAAVLGILGLLGVLPLYMAAIATIAVGAALLIEGVGITARFNRLREGLNGDSYELAGIGGGMAVETLGGAAGITLGVLALLGIQPLVLLPIAAIVFGATIVIGAGAAQEVEQIVHRRTPGGGMLHQAVSASHGTRLLVGLGAATLGILVLADVGVPLVLTLVAMLALGAAEFLFGSALGARMGKAAT